MITMNHIAFHWKKIVKYHQYLMRIEKKEMLLMINIKKGNQMRSIYILAISLNLLTI